MERDAQLEEIRKRREEKLALLRSKGIGKKRDARNNNSKSDVTEGGKGTSERTKVAVELDAQNIKSDVRRKESDLRDVRNERGTHRDASHEERSIRRVSFSEDLEDEDLEAEELKMIKNKKNFVIGKWMERRSGVGVVLKEKWIRQGFSNFFGWRPLNLPENLATLM